jgi:hypothetical protein
LAFGRKFAAMEDVWANRDLPVLRAVVEIYDETGHHITRASAVERRTGFDNETVQRALRALQTVPFFQEINAGVNVGVGPPMRNAYQVAGAWPTPESMVDRLIAAFEAAATDEGLDEPERRRAQKIRDGLVSGGSKIAIAALGSAGGHFLYS